MWTRIAALIVKELLTIWKDRRGRVVLIVPPLVQLVIFGHAATFDVNNAALAVLNEDTGLASRELVSRFAGSPAFTPTARLGNVREIAATIDSERAVIVLHIGPTFSRDLVEGGPAKVQIVVDGRHSNTAAILANYAAAIIAEFNLELGRIAGAQVRGPPARLAVRAWHNPNMESQVFIVPGLVAVLTLVVATLVTALSVARERELGTFEQLLVTPLRPVEILIGKVVPPFLIAYAEATLILVVAVLVFDIRFVGSVWMLYGGLAIYLIAIIAIGLMISATAKTQQQAIVGAFLFMMPAITLSGFATPIANMPGWIQAITYLNPVRYFLIIDRGIFLQDMPLDVVAGQIWPLAIISAVCMTVATWLFRRRLQ